MLLAAEIYARTRTSFLGVGDKELPNYPKEN